MKLNFKLDIKKDFDNYYYTANEKESHFSYELCFKTISEQIRKLIQDKSRDEAYKNFMPLLKESYKKNIGHLNSFIKQAQKNWDEIGEKFLERLEKITNKKFPFEKITVYLTTIFVCPYDYKERWFMTSFLNHPLLSTQVCAHELMHFHFLYYYFDEIKKKIGEEKAEDLKEALTVLLNLEFRDLFFISFKDTGFDKHRELREFITKVWEKEKNYDRLLDDSVNYLR